MKRELYYIAVEGVIGAGKTSLAQILAQTMNGMLILEQHEENPFLEDFYHDPRRFAFQTQLYFLLSRFRQQEEFPHPDLFHQRVLSDYLFARDRIFATINLDERELRLYDMAAGVMEARAPTPDLVVYLQSSTRRLMHNIRIRNRSYEQNIPEEYIEELNEAYNRFFWSYNAAPLLMVNADNIDFVENERHLKELLEAIESPFQGTRYYNPMV